MPGPVVPRTYAYVNGKVTLASHASISVFDRGLVLGDGLFETLRARQGIPEFWPLHYRRLTRSARRLRLKIPLTESKLRGILRDLCGRSRLADAMVRITLTRGHYQGGLAIDPAIAPSLIVTVMPVTGLPPELYEQGVRVVISGINKMAASGLDPQIKSTNYLANIFAKAEADQKNCYEAILLGPRGQIAELSTSSFFCVIQGNVLTPPIETGILPGITRQVLLREIRLRKIPGREADLFPKDVARMSEAFLCSSVRGLLPITRIDGRKIGNGKVGPIYRRLRQLYALACERGLARPF
jgi:branched-chain amino acid aminotransferase